jgi:spore maturation protein CgeB
MRIAMFYHSLVSDWNHGNAHFLRGIASELLVRGHDVRIYESEGNWSRANLIEQQGERAIADFEAAYPGLRSHAYRSYEDIDAAVDDVDAVIVHEWNPPELIERLARKPRRYRVYFHDTHHRCVSDPKFTGALGCDGVLAYGESLRRQYEARGWASRVWVWHEAADTRVFKPVDRVARCGDLVWIGNWGDDERTRELEEFLFSPVRKLALQACVYGVRYPDEALEALRRSGIRYAGWAPNFRVPQIFSGFDITVHVPRRPYREQLPGVPTIRVFEALACGIPMVTAPWDDCEHLFEPGRDYLVAHDGGEMADMLGDLIRCERLRKELAERGLRTIHERHTCAHRVDQLLEILRQE